MTAAPVPEVCDDADCAVCTSTPAATAEQTVADLLALLGVYEAKAPAWRTIPTHVLRDLLDGAR